MSSEYLKLKIQELGEVKSGKRLPRGHELTSAVTEFPYIRLVDVSNGRVQKDSLRFLKPETRSTIKRYVVNSGDVCLAIVGHTIGMVFYVDSDFDDVNLTENAARITSFKNFMNSKYLYYYLTSPLGQAEIRARKVGSAQGKLPLYNIKSLEIPIPPKFEQDEIVETLDALDDRITLLRETNTTLEAIAQALFKSWFVDFDPVRAKAEGRQPEGMDATTADLFPNSFEESELGLVPKGWAVSKFGDFINRLPVGQKYDQKSAFPEGRVPVLDQGKSGIIGYHNDSPGVKASLEDPVVVFANHTCYMRLITFDFSAIQNVLPFNGRGVDTVWAFYATKDRVKFSEYKGHWPDFAIEKSVLPPAPLTYAFRDVVDPVIRKIRFNELQAQTLIQLRDTLLPRLISGQLRLPETEVLVTESMD
ncbi:restriction endonuclease subunit S [Pseudomonas sp. Ga0074129]|uniref:restriction endonuclease subunit S n=1 Tax=Pseudomonas sp. Ga0074129 TaxID=1752219 RepID=UPI000B1558AA|nr:restriction endonuclease subunit S [Pseudomonas sp. Ga0074129]